jgi:Ca2+-binding EF-hand superfamily protein
MLGLISCTIPCTIEAMLKKANSSGDGQIRYKEF